VHIVVNPHSAFAVHVHQLRQIASDFSQHKLLIRVLKSFIFSLPYPASRRTVSYTKNAQLLIRCLKVELLGIWGEVMSKFAPGSLFFGCLRKTVEVSESDMLR
jgi:hypothetical protein